MPMIGLIAQDVREVIPEVVSENGDRLGLSYDHLVALVVKSIQQISNMIDNIIDRLNGVDDRLNTQQKQIDELIKQNKDLNNKINLLSKKK